MKVYKTVQIAIVDFLNEDVLTTSEGEVKGVYECVNDLDPVKNSDWF